MQALELHVAEMSLVDLHGQEPMAGAIAGPAEEIARASEIAIAVLDMLSLHPPRDHELPPASAAPAPFLLVV
jgi:hypothetical protein